MTRADVVSDRIHKTNRLERPTYVPPHLRHFVASPYGGSQFHNGSYGFAAESAQSGVRFGRSGPRQHGRNGPGRGRSGGGGGRGVGRGQGYGGRSREALELNPHRKESGFDDFEKFDELEVIEDDDNEGDINFRAYENIPVEASGSEIPPPVNKFVDIDLAEGLNQNIKRCRYVKPTPIQRHALPISVAGRDLMACAQTGSGKTAAFCFPIVSGILKDQGKQLLPARNARIAHPRALIMSPTRELSCQIHEEAKKFAYQTGVKIVVAYGGAPISQQFRNLDRGVDILVATPGRLVDMVERARVSLKMVKYLALDEADRMLDMGFEPQIRKIVEQMDMPPPGKRQTMLFSATFPDEIQRLASDFLSNYIFLAVGRVGSSTDLIAQRVELVQDIEKRNRLMDLIRGQKENGANCKHLLTLVFVETKRGADALENWLSVNGFPAIAIHGDKVQMEREQALRSFKTGATPVMVATDVVSRGLDIPDVAHVINFDMPKNIDDYVHRIGRTGRAGKSGIATAFFNDRNMPLAKSLVELMREANQEIPPWLLQYAEIPSHGVGSLRAQRHRGSKFAGYDLRRSTQSSSENYHPSSSYVNADYYAAAADSYSPGLHGYGFSYESVVASGWD